MSTVKEKTKNELARNITVLLVDDHSIVRRGLRDLFD
jgi:hypothetical protein